MDGDDRGKYLLQKQPCSECGSSDAKVYYTNGSSYCFKCQTSKRVDMPGTDAVTPQPRKARVSSKLTFAEAKELPIAQGIPSRGINETVCKEYGVRIEYNTATREPKAYLFPYYKGNELVGFKVRSATEKDFYTLGHVGSDVDLFGWQAARDDAMRLIITEGEMDALAARQMFKEKGKDYKVVSVPNGAQAAGAALRKNLSRLQGVGGYYINFDMDEPGLEATQEACEIMPAGKVHVMSLPEGFKDANDILLKGKAYQYMDALWNAKLYRPDSIIAGEDTWELYANRPDIQSYPFPEDWSELNKMTYGIRLGELDTITSGTSAGKTQWAREIMYHYLKTTDLKLGILSLEEPLTDTVESYLELELNKRISLPDVEATMEEKRAAWQATFGTKRLVLYDAFGGEESRVVNAIRFMARGMGCQAIMVDHLHMLLDGKDSEKDQIERIMLTLKKLTQELGVWIGLIAHLKKSDGGATFEEGGVANLDDLKGSSSIKQLSNGVYVLARNQIAEDALTRNMTHIWVKKCRFTGRTGQADTLLFDDDTGRMKVLRPDDVPW